MSLRLHSLRYVASRQTILDGVTLHVRDGDCYGFLGHNGAGKTTALRIALGLLRPRRGRVIVDGFDAARHPREARARLGGLIEVPGFHADLGGAQNLFLLARLRGLSRREARREVERVLGDVSLAREGRKRVRAYSQGMRQRLGVAQALLGGPTHVLLDEPMNGLDPEGLDELRTTLRELTRRSGVTVLLSSHQLDELEGLCNRIGILRRGRMILEEDVATLRGNLARRHALVTAAPERAMAALPALGVEVVERRADRLVVRLGDRAPEAFLRAALDAGIEVSAFHPEVERLEEVYLRATRSETPERDLPAPPPVPARSTPPRERRAHGLPSLRVLRYELTRVSFARRALLLAIPALVGIRQIMARREEVDLALAQLARGAVANVTQVTAYEAFGFGLAWGLPILAVVLVLLGSQSIAAEDASGTLRNVLLTPQRRIQVALGKGLALCALTLVGYALLVGSNLWVAGELFAFEGVYEILPNGERMEHVETAFLQEQLERLLWRPLLPLAAFAATGFCLSTWIRRPVGAFAAGLCSFLLLVFGWSSVKRHLELEAWLPTTYLPRGLPKEVVGADTSFLEYYTDVAQGSNNALDLYAETVVTAPTAWIAAAVVLGLLVFRWRAVR